MRPDAANLIQALAVLAEEYDSAPQWPQRSVDLIAEAGCWGWVIPWRWGGAPLGNAELLERYQTVARGCLATALLLTQRDGACDLIARGENETLKQRLLPAHARGERFTSIGISQLTTSKGKEGPKLAAEPAGDGFVLDGVMPWVTGAIRCDEIVTGAELADSRQIVACVPCDRAGVVVEQPMKFLALDASCTSRVRCERVRIGREEMVRGPAEAALSLRTPVKPLVVSAVGLGAAQGLVNRLEQKVDRLGQDLREIIAALAGELGRVRDDLHAAAALLNDPTAELPAARIRIQVNELLTRLAVAFLTVSKGTGYARPHAAERLLREAAFFHVWSAPGAVQAGTLRRMSSGAGES